MSTTALFTLNDYDQLIECCAFAPPHHRRCELIRGEIRDMSPIGRVALVGLSASAASLE